MSNHEEETFAALARSIDPDGVISTAPARAEASRNKRQRRAEAQDVGVSSSKPKQEGAPDSGVSSGAEAEVNAYASGGASSEVEGPLEEAEGPGEEAEGRDEIKIVRATMRLRIDPLPVETRRALEYASRESVRVLNFLTRQMVTDDARALDAFQLEHGRNPKKGAEWPAPKTYLYNEARKLAPDLASGLVATLARAVAQKWNTERWDTLIFQKRSPSHYKIGATIPIRGQDLRVRDGVVSVQLFSKEAASVVNGGTSRTPVVLTTRYNLPVGIHDPRQRAAIDALVKGEWRIGQAALQQDRLRPWKWYVRISYTRLVPRTTEKQAAAVTRGIKNFLVAITDAGDLWCHDGRAIEAFLRRTQARRRDIQRAIKASGRVGHGRARALQPIHVLMDKADRWRRTQTQTIARRVAKWLRDRKIGLLFMEDLSGIRDGEPERLEGGERVWRRVQEWPYFDLGTRIVSCLEEYGIETRVVPANYLSMAFFCGCPACGSRDLGTRDLRKWLLRCACGYAEDLDRVATRNVLARGLDPKILEGSKIAEMDAKLSAKKATARKPPKKPKQSRDKRGPPSR